MGLTCASPYTLQASTRLGHEEFFDAVVSCWLTPDGSLQLQCSNVLLDVSRFEVFTVCPLDFEEVLGNWRKSATKLILNQACKERVAIIDSAIVGLPNPINVVLGSSISHKTFACFWVYEVFVAEPSRPHNLDFPASGRIVVIIALVFLGRCQVQDSDSQILVIGGGCIDGQLDLEWPVLIVTSYKEGRVTANNLSLST